MIMMMSAADHGPLTVMVMTDEGVRYWGSGELVGPAPDNNSTQVQIFKIILFSEFFIESLFI